MPEATEKRLRQNEDAIADLLHRTKEHEQRLDDGKEQIAANAKNIGQLIAVMQGVMGRPGIVEESASLHDRVTAIENWKRDIRAFIAGVAFIGAIVGSLLSTLLIWALNLIKV